MWIPPDRSQYPTEEAYLEACKALSDTFKKAGRSNIGVTIGVRRCPKCGERLGFSDWCNACEVRRAFGAVRCDVCGTGHPCGQACPKCALVFKPSPVDDPPKSGPIEIDLIPGITYLPDPRGYNIGWECPKCNRTFAPFVPHCDVCHAYPLKTSLPTGQPPWPLAPPWETIKVVCRSDGPVEKGE